MNHANFDETLDVIVDGNSMTPELLVACGYRPSARLTIDEEAMKGVARARLVIDEVVSSGRVVYGISTGFGKFATTIIDKQDLQVNLIRSPCAGVGEPLPPNRVRMMLVLRINVLARGNSGIRPENLRIM